MIAEKTTRQAVCLLYGWIMVRLVKAGEYIIIPYIKGSARNRSPIIASHRTSLETYDLVWLERPMDTWAW
jgi:hypothetical protein